MHLLEKLLYELKPHGQALYSLCKVKTYQVVLTRSPKNCSLNLPKTISLGDECSEGTVKVLITLQAPPGTVPDSFTFSLVSTDGTIKRPYVVLFRFKNEG